MLVGRAAETTWLKRRVALARRGSGSAVLLTGEPGVGKTALVRDLCRRTRGVDVLRADGVESEATLGFSALADICRPLLSLLERIPEPQAAALSGALALGPAVGFDRFAAYAGVLSLLAANAERQPLLVFVDDAHWVDAESAQALAFCARRIYAEPILLVFVAREGEPLPFPHDAFEPLALGRLDAGGASELLAMVGDGRVVPAVATRLYAATAGNPLALIEIASLLSGEQLDGRAALPEPLPVDAGIERLFWRRIARQTAPTRRVLLLAAASDRGSTEEISRALPAMKLTPRHLERAGSAGLITIADGRVQFTHPLLRAVVYGAAPAAERRGAHRALAEAVTGPDAPLRRAWHRASATTGPDESVAAELEEAGTHMATRTGFAAATGALERAAALSDDDEAHARRMMAAGRSAYLAGMLERAREATRETVKYTTDPLLLADCERLRGEVEIYAGNVLEAHRLLTEAAKQVAPHDPAREAELLIAASLPLFNAAQIDLGYEAARHAQERAAGVGGEIEVIAQVVLGGALILRGERRSGYKIAIEGIDLAAQLPLGVGVHLMHGGLLSVWAEDYERARTVSTGLVSSLRAAGALTPLPYALSALSELEFRTGHFAAALAAASEAVSIATEIAERATAAYSLVSLARVEAATGREQEAQEHARQALRINEQADAGAIMTYAGAALGLLELGLSRPDRALGHLAPLPEQKRRAGVVEPNAIQWQPDLIEANIRLGEHEQAETHLAQLESQARKTGGRWALAAAERCRGLLAPEDQFHPHFAKALSLHERTPTPFERARTRLSFGERLRRAGERRRARESLDAALETFGQLGATPWASHAEAELSATGATRGRPEREQTQRLPQELLTSHELQVALTVADGGTNKQAAATLFISPKTIEFHLGQIYRKLGIHSRTQLARVMLAGSRRDQ